MGTIDTDYLVVGAGAAGMAFTDSLITDSDADVVLVDRRHRPGGHWNDAYPFVRLHQPAAFYGVNSMVLGTESIDTAGPNAGLYDRSTGAEICDYFNRVLDERLLPSGQVRFLGMSDHDEDGAGGHRVVSRLTGEATTVRVRRRVVDATYQETAIPSTHAPSFTVDPDVRFVAVNDLVRQTEAATGYTVLGAGKTAMDACSWLLDNGVDPDRIRWIRPRDAWLQPRESVQPLDLVTNLLDGLSLQLEAAAEATDEADLFRRLEACGQLVRLDPDVEPTMYRCATSGRGELEQLRTIGDVVRLGRVRHLGADRIDLDGGSIPTDRGQVHVDCTAAGLRLARARPIWEPGRITLQQLRTCQPTFNAAVIGFVETFADDDAGKNRLCTPNPYPDTARDWITATLTSHLTETSWGARPELAAWLEASRLNAARKLGDQAEDPRMQAAMTRYLVHGEAAATNLAKLRDLVATGAS